MGVALYRKYRSKSLDEVVGQEHITRTLKNALNSGSISHAYLFTGPRGVGKTSIARILAHEVNGLPYNEDSIHLDIIEIDAASNRRIDEIRELREKVHNSPTSAKYKVYIIDEVHMLTREAFNALLKTLEEPPAHAIFILATTEAHKLPETIISRCLRFTFKPIQSEAAVKHLESIAKKEKINIDRPSLALIAEHGQGSFRDSISLLDQIRGYKEQIELADVEQLLGIAPTQAIGDLYQILASGKAAELLDTLSDLRDKGYSASSIAKQLGGLLRLKIQNSQTAELGGEKILSLLEKLIGVPASSNPYQLLELVLLGAVLDSNDQQVSISTNDEPNNQPPQEVANEPMPKTSVDEPSPLKLDSRRIARSQNESARAKTVFSEGEVSKDTSKEEKLFAAEISRSGDGGVLRESSKEAIPEEIVQIAEPALPSPTAETSESLDIWEELLNALKKKYSTVYGVARMAQPIFLGEQLTLVFQFAFHQKKLSDAKTKSILTDLLQESTGIHYQIECILKENESFSPPKEARQKPKNDRLQNISNIFGGAELLES